MDTIIPIQINTTGGSISVTVAVPDVPLSIGGVIWRFNSDENFDMRAGKLIATPAIVPLGSPSLLKSKIFLIEGGVLHPEDNRTVHYNVVVTVSQDGKDLHSEVPSEDGSGKIDTQDISFLYRFQLI